MTIEFRDADELATLMAAGEIDVCMLPVPNVTSVLMKNSDVRAALDLTEEWNALDNGSILTMGCVVVRREFAEENPEAVAAFVEEYRESIEAVAGDPGGRVHARGKIRDYGQRRHRQSRHTRLQPYLHYGRGYSSRHRGLL